MAQPANSTVPHVYCINIKSCVERRARMEQRFAIAGVNATFVDALPFRDKTLDAYTANCAPWYDNRDQWLKDVACLLSHLRAIGAFLHSKQEWGIICEDDVLLHNEFVPRLTQLMTKLPEGCPLVSLGFIITGRFAMNRHNEDFYHVDCANTWGGQCYMMSRSYALEAMKNFHKPMRELKANYANVTAELTIRYSRGYLAAQALAIEDCIDSVRKPRDLPHHTKHMCAHDYRNFSAGDPKQLSPLAKMGPERGWFHYREYQGTASHAEVVALQASVSAAELEDEMAQLRVMFGLQ